LLGRGQTWILKSKCLFRRINWIDLFFVCYGQPGKKDLYAYGMGSNNFWKPADNYKFKYLLSLFWSISNRILHDWDAPYYNHDKRIILKFMATKMFSNSVTIFGGCWICNSHKLLPLLRLENSLPSNSFSPKFNYNGDNPILFIIESCIFIIDK
jgi:hypothetical protein